MSLLSSRRGFLAGLGAALITAPAIVRAGSLMPVRAMCWDLAGGDDITALCVCIVAGTDSHGFYTEVGTFRQMWTHGAGTVVDATTVWNAVGDYEVGDIVRVRR